MGAGLFAALALIYTARNFTLARRQLDMSLQAMEQTDRSQRRTLELTEQGQVTDRYTRAVEQLGSDRLDVRIGGIYALERIALDSPRDHPTVIEVLAAFVREHSFELAQHPLVIGGTEQKIRADVEAAMSTLGRLNGEYGVKEINLGGVNLHRGNLNAINLSGSNMIGATATHAFLNRANLEEATLFRSDLSGAFLSRANLKRANLVGAVLTGATLSYSDLSGAELRGAVLTDAKLSYADLSGAELRGAVLTGADASDAKFNDVDFVGWTSFDGKQVPPDFTDADITDADFTGASWPRQFPPPEGWQLDSDSGQLSRATPAAP